jgi:hypothetical protein
VKPYYADSRVTLWHGDALDVLPGMSSAGIIALDPPYSMVPNSVRAATMAQPAHPAHRSRSCHAH